MGARGKKPLAGLGGCLETYFWQTPHSMMPLASWMAVWCTNTGYSVSQGCSRSCFLCLWAVGDRGMCVRRVTTHHKGLMKPICNGDNLQFVTRVGIQWTSTQQKVQLSVEALHCCVALPRASEIYFRSIRRHCTALGPKASTYFTPYSPAAKETGKEGSSHHFKHPEMGMQT